MKSFFGTTVILILIFFMFSVTFDTSWYYHATQRFNLRHQLFEQQDAIEVAVKNLHVINAVLENELLPRIPSAARATVSNLSSNMNSVPVTTRFSTVNTITVPGHKPAVYANSLPLSQWIDFLPDMVQHNCTFILSKDITDPDAKARYTSYSYAMLSCPIFINNNIIGNLAISWDKEEDVPTDSLEMERIKTTMIEISKKIGIIVTSELLQK